MLLYEHMLAWREFPLNQYFTGNGQIDFDEFVNLMTSKMKEMSRDETEMREAFKVFDRNGDGK